MLLRELVGGDPPYTCKVIFLDDPSRFGHRVTDGGRVTEHVLTRHADFDDAVADRIAGGWAETERSLTRRVFVLSGRYWIVALDGDTVRTQSGRIQTDWRESSGHTRDKAFRDRDRAVAAYHRAIADKEAEGYAEQYARPTVIDADATPTKRPGKRKSR